MTNFGTENKWLLVSGNGKCAFCCLVLKNKKRGKNKTEEKINYPISTYIIYTEKRGRKSQNERETSGRVRARARAKKKKENANRVKLSFL